MFRRRVTRYDAGPPARRPLLWPWLAVLLVLVIGGIVTAYLLTRDNGSSSSSSATKPHVPNVVGLSTGAAMARLGQSGYPAIVNTKVTSSARLGTVLSQAPSAGTELDRGGQVTITVARGRGTVEVPNVVGLSGVRALTRLQAAGLKGTASSIASQEPKGRVLRQAPAGGAQANKGTTVLLTLSKGRVLVLVKVPFVEGKNEVDARAILSRLLFRASVTRIASNRPKGIVVAQLPRAGTRALQGLAVALKVSSGGKKGSLQPPKGSVIVPNVVGLSQQAAVVRIQRKGLQVDSYPTASSRPAGTVVSQLPTANSSVAPGSKVRINVSTGTGQRQRKAVPDVTGQPERAAEQTLIRAGFTVRTVDRPTSNSNENGLVVEQQPAAGQRVPVGSQIVLYIGRTPTPTD